VFRIRVYYNKLYYKSIYNYRTCRRRDQRASARERGAKVQTRSPGRHCPWRVFVGGLTSTRYLVIAVVVVVVIVLVTEVSVVFVVVFFCGRLYLLLLLTNVCVVYSTTQDHHPYGIWRHGRLTGAFALGPKL
jgi:hypothetical protein